MINNRKKVFKSKLLQFIWQQISGNNALKLKGQDDLCSRTLKELVQEISLL